MSFVVRAPRRLPFALATIGVMAAVLTTPACDNPGDGAAADAESLARQAVIRDSAGVRIVENPRPPADTRLGWEVGTEPAVSIGALEGEEPYLLDRVRGALTLADGRIVVADIGSNELRVFDAWGRYQSTWGGTGDGPGEFENLLGFDRWPGDSLITWFAQGRRLTVFDNRGHFGRTFALEGAIHRSPEVALPTGRILASEAIPETILRDLRQDGLHRREDLYQVHGAEGEQQARLGTFYATETHREYSGSRIRVMSLLFDHDIASFMWGDLVVVAPNYSYEIRAFDADGTLRRIVRRDHEVIARTASHVDAYIEDRVTREPERLRADRRRTLRERYEGIPLPETHPAFVTAIADALDHLWVQEYRLPGEGDAAPLWTIFDPQGRVLGLVETPAGVTDIYEIGDNHILGRATDDLGVEYVQAWPLSRREGY
ncbi:MAG: 6-bladed beta-propeller [Gemmatimonadota bacterium]|nr:6-bladed beta-propeller [Gemmatimonadota bacterium]MDE2865939.1 6-bladed beta-propeller [Gemmatimonadota bacterium]